MAHKAAQAQQAGRPEQAAALYRRMLEAAPHNGTALAQLGKLQLMSGNTGEAVTYLTQVPAKAPERAEAAFYLCLAHGREQRWAEAEKAGREAVKRLPNFAPAHEKLAAVLLETGRPAESARHFRQAVRLGASGPETRAGLAKALHYQAKFDLRLKDRERREAFDESVRLFTAAVSEAPDSAFVRTGLADVLFALERFDDALPHYLAAFDLDRDNRSVGINTGLTLARIGSPERKALLARLGEDHVYESPAEAAGIAIKLADSCPFPDPRPVKAAVAALEALDPARAAGRAWWRERLQVFSPQCPDLVLRSVFTRVFAWSIPTVEALDAIAAFADGAPVGSYGAGNGYWEYLLQSAHGVRVHASDLELKHRFMPVERLNFNDARPDPAEVVMISWILNDAVVEKAVLALLGRLSSGQKLVIIGDRPDAAGRPGACGSARLFRFLAERFEGAGGVDLPRFAHCNDGVDFYVSR